MITLDGDVKITDFGLALVLFNLAEGRLPFKGELRALTRGQELERVMYVGNDLNDLLPMMRCGIRVCPADSHPRVLALANFPLATRGGEGVMREVVEELMQFDLVKVLYS